MIQLLNYSWLKTINWYIHYIYTYYVFNKFDALVLIKYIYINILKFCINANDESSSLYF